jgi:hypothetical protein
MAYNRNNCNRFRSVFEDKIGERAHGNSGVRSQNLIRPDGLNGCDYCKFGILRFEGHLVNFASTKALPGQ